jgi:hypothetical protein
MKQSEFATRPVSHSAAYTRLQVNFGTHLKSLGRTILVAAGLILSASAVHATNWYVRSGGAGSGSGADWNNASSLGGINWGSVKPGDTIWLAGGNYNDSLHIQASGTSSAYINIKRVRSTDSAPTAAAGWNSAFDSQVVVAPTGNMPCYWDGANGLGSYVAIDGRMDSGISFQLANLSGMAYPGAVYFAQSVNGTAFVTLTNLEMCGPVPSGAITYSGNSYLTALAFRGGPYGGSGIYVTDITVSGCRIHGAFDLVLLVGVQRCVFDHCKFYDAPFDSGPNQNHPNVTEWAFSGNITYRYSEFYNWYSEGIMMGSSPDPDPNPYGACYLYGNVFHDPNSGAYSARVVEARWKTQTLYSYNNTFVNFTGNPFVYSQISGNGQFSSSSQCRNNIYWNSQISTPPADMDYEFSSSTVGGAHSISGGTMPFVNLTGKDFHLVTTTGALLPRNKGISLVAPYNYDGDGDVRGADGAWDIGAYEVSTGGAGLSVSQITQNATDVDPNTPGMQVYPGTTVLYSGTATDSNPFTWQWVYTVNGGAENVFQSGSGTIPAITYTYPSNSVGNTYIWIMRASDGTSTQQSQFTVSVEALPVAQTGLSFAATSGVITSPLVSSNGYISQPIETGVTNGGTATYTFTITNAGSYVVQALVNAPNAAQNSFYVNIDAQPTDPYMVWQIPITTGFQNEVVSWQGTGTYDNPQFVPEVFNLTAGTHQLIFVGRESGTLLQTISILKMVQPPQDLRVVPMVASAPVFPLSP